MFDKILLKEKLEQILEALKRINRRFQGISEPEDFEFIRKNFYIN